MNRLKQVGASLVATVMMVFGVATQSSSPAHAAPPQGQNACAGGVTVLAHKGGGAYAPGNTVPAIQYAGSIGAKAIEVDLVFSKSNYAFALHDNDMSRWTDAPTGTLVSNLWLPDVQKYSAADYAPWNADVRYAGYNADGTPKVRAPFTREILEAAKAAGVNEIFWDVKMTPSRAAVDQFLGYLAQAQFRGVFKHMSWGGNAATIKAMRDVAPVGTFTYDTGESMVDTIRPGSWIQAQGLDRYGMPSYRIDKPTVDYWKTYGVTVTSWTTNYPENDVPSEWLRMRDIGVDYFSTDHPKQALEALGCGSGAPVPDPTTPAPSASAEPIACRVQ